MSALTAEAYRRCEAITREQAANFYYGIRLLPGDRRRAMCAAYAFARHVDDIGDGTLEAQEKLDDSTPRRRRSPRSPHRAPPWRGTTP